MFSAKKMPYFIGLGCFLIGIYFPSNNSSQPTLSHDLSQEWGVMNLSNSSDNPKRLQPYRIVIDGKGEEFPNVSRKGEQWRIDFADGRVTIYASTGGVEK